MKKITLATKITIVRILLSPIIFYSMMMGHWSAALMLFLVAAGTDFFDGIIARYYNQQTQLGALLDTAADKILILSSCIAFFYSMPLSVQSSRAIAIFIVVSFCKEMFLLGGSLFFYVSRYFFSIRPTMSGKIAAAMQMVFIFLVITTHVSENYSFIDTQRLLDYLMFVVYTMTFFLIVSCVQYSYQAIRIMHNCRH